MNFLKSLWRKWLRFAQVIGNFQAQVILIVFYVAILSPVGIILRFLADPLRLPFPKGTNFVDWEHPKESLEEARKQY